MKWTLLDTEEDIKWLKDVYLKNLSDSEKAEIKSAVLEGNEDSPSKIVCYASSVPTIDEVPLFIINPIW